MVRGALILLALALPGAGVRVPLLDLKPAFFKGEDKIRRNRTRGKPGLFVAGKRYRGLNVPARSRIGFELDGAFLRLSLRLAVLDGGRGSVRFKILGDGRVLAATPPLFPASAPIKVEVAVERVLLLELITEPEGAADGTADGKAGSRAGWLEGVLVADKDRDLGAFRAVRSSFDERDYPYAFRKRVNGAIERGARFLRTSQAENGSWPGRYKPLGLTALMTLAMLKTGVKRDAPAMIRAFRFLDQQPLDHTYSVSILLMALEARYFPGGADPKQARRVIPEKDRARIRMAADWLVSKQGEWPTPVWRYPRGRYDLSNTQYALFGLSAASRCGAPTGKVWMPALRFLLEAQEDARKAPVLDVTRYRRDGRYLRRIVERARARGFGYTLGRSATGSMTTAGLCSLILCRQVLARDPTFKQRWSKSTRHAIRDALAWMEEYYELEENPFRYRSWWTYYLFNVERAGVLLDQRYIGTRDWYREGAELLLARQRATGAFGNLLDTAFALLFLKKATVPAKTPSD